MQAFTPKKPTSDSGHPGDEELAAYIDGLLGEKEKARVTEHLAACADCYRVYSEILRFQLEEEEQEEEVAAAANGTVVPFPSDRKVRPPWWLAAAAAVLVIGLGAGLFTLFGPAQEMTTAELVEPLPPAVGELWMDSNDRGAPGEEAPLVEEEFWSADTETLFRIGVQLVNLQVSLERNDRAVEGQVLPKLIELLRQDLVASLVPEYQKYYTDLRVAIAAGAAPRTFLQKSSETSEELRKFLDDSYLELGRFVEAGRLAAIAEEPSFFKRWRTRRMLGDLLKQQKKGELELDPETVRALKAVSARLKKGELQATDYAALRKNFEDILLEHYPK